ncbi:uncharacterized protein LOC127081258 [Lathyrus oleraceus]|uniref:uncharacterized protein LOC127081258 n=1 Tax=Pisum sativum TaxID=3888 RepID=UPI0021D33AA4|nr:uncharacterized protein LOC127081258 [Pisum sativum]
MSQHQTISDSKTTKSTHKVSAPSMDIHDDEILDVVPLSIIPCEALDLNHPMDASAPTCPNQGHSVKGVSTPLSKMYSSLEVAQHSEKNNDSSNSEKDMAAKGLCSLGQTVSGKGKSVASKTANASHSEKQDVADDVIDLEDDMSYEQEDSLLHHLKLSVAKRMKTRKGRSVAEMMVVVERELGKDAVEVKEVIDLIKTAGLMKTMVGFSQCYEGLVKQFIVNIPEDIADKNNKEFCKVFVRGKCITFSPTVINNFMGKRFEGAGELEATDNEVCREITVRQVKGWPIKKHLPDGKLTVKYAILHKIGAANWVPTNHISTIANTLGRFIFAVGTKMNFYYGRFMFEQIIKHASTNTFKLYIAFPSMICGIVLNQHPGVLSSNDLPSRRKPALLLTTDYVLGFVTP